MPSATAEHQYYFSHLLRKRSHTHSVYVARLQIRARFLVAVRQVAFYCYNAKLDTPSRYGILLTVRHAGQDAGPPQQHDYAAKATELLARVQEVLRLMCSS